MRGQSYRKKQISTIEIFICNICSSKFNNFPSTVDPCIDFALFFCRSTNMKCLTPEKTLAVDWGFMSGNLYARSVFGEEMLANLSVEKPFPIKMSFSAVPRSQRGPPQSVGWTGFTTFSRFRFSISPSASCLCRATGTGIGRRLSLG